MSKESEAPNCLRCAHLTEFANCAAILRGEVLDKQGQPYLPGRLYGPPSPTAWAGKCGRFEDTGYRVSYPQHGEQWR